MRSKKEANEMISLADSKEHLCLKREKKIEIGVCPSSLWKKYWTSEILNT